jgi:hypothetical protein
MEGIILLGQAQQVIEFPQATWKQHVDQIPDHSRERLSFMTDQHHQVRNFVVRELVNRMEPLQPELISESLKMPLKRVIVILEELERELFFLVRNERGAVAWAFPMTVEPTPHRLHFSTGERLYGA